MQKIFHLFLVSVFFLSSSQIYALDNTDLLSTEPSITAPKFSYHTFSTCTEFEDTMRKILPKETLSPRGGIMYDTVAVPTVAPASMEKSTAQQTGNTPHSETNVQVRGIDEADIVKTDGRYIYSYQAGEGGIFILDAKNLNKVKTIKIPVNYANPTFYITKNKLILTATRYSNSSRSWTGWYNNSQKSIVALYDISDIANTKLSRLIQVDGSLSDTRLEDNGLMTAVVSTSYWTPPYYRMAHQGAEATPVYDYSSKNLIPRISDEQYIGSKRKTTNRTIADCSRMSSLLPDAKTLSSYTFSPTLTSIIRLDTSVSNSTISSQVVVSEAGQVHVSRDSIYLTSNLWTPYNTSTSTAKCAPDSPCAQSMIWNPGTN